MWFTVSYLTLIEGFRIKSLLREQRSSWTKIFLKEDYKFLLDFFNWELFGVKSQLLNRKCFSFQNVNSKWKVLLWHIGHLYFGRQCWHFMLFLIWKALQNIFILYGSKFQLVLPILMRNNFSCLLKFSSGLKKSGEHSLISVPFFSHEMLQYIVDFFFRITVN